MTFMTSRARLFTLNPFVLTQWVQPI